MLCQCSESAQANRSYEYETAGVDQAFDQKRVQICAPASAFYQMFDLSEDNIARLLVRDVTQLAERAKGAPSVALNALRTRLQLESPSIAFPDTEVGVTAYTQKAVHRTRPNEQFLQATLRNIQAGQAKPTPAGLAVCFDLLCAIRQSQK